MSAQNTSADWPATTEEQVMAAVQAGSVDAVEVLYDRYHERAYNLPPGTVKGRIRLGLQRLRVDIQR